MCFSAARISVCTALESWLLLLLFFFPVFSAHETNTRRSQCQLNLNRTLLASLMPFVEFECVTNSQTKKVRLTEISKRSSLSNSDHSSLGEGTAFLRHDNVLLAVPPCLFLCSRYQYFLQVKQDLIHGK